MTYRVNTTEMQCEQRQSSHGSSRRHRSKEHKKSEKYAYYRFSNASEKKPWSRADRFKVAICEEELEKKLSVGNDAATVMSLLPPTQLKHITKVVAETNEQEESSRSEWKVASIGHEGPLMWCLLKREKKEKTEKKERREKKAKKERTEKVSKSSKHGSKINDLPALTHEELQSFFTQQYIIPSHATQCYQPPYVQPGGINSSYYYPAQPAIQEVTSTPTIGGICSPYTSCDDSNSSGYSSDAESVSSSLTTASTASSSSTSSVATPPPPRAPLRGILKTKQQRSTEVVIHPNASPETSEQDSTTAVCYSGVIKNPSAHSYIATAPHAMKDFTESREKGYMAEYQLETASNTSSSTSSSSTSSVRFSDEASFCIAYDYYDDEASEDDYYLARVESRSTIRRTRRAAEPGALAVSKYVEYGSDD